MSAQVLMMQHSRPCPPACDPSGVDEMIHRCTGRSDGVADPDAGHRHLGRRRRNQQLLTAFPWWPAATLDLGVFARRVQDLDGPMKLTIVTFTCSVTWCC
jgi:hypothetical protein